MLRKLPPLFVRWRTPEAGEKCESEQVKQRKSIIGEAKSSMYYAVIKNTQNFLRHKCFSERYFFILLNINFSSLSQQNYFNSSVFSL